MKERIKPLNSETVYQGKVFRLVRSELLIDDTRRTHYDVVEHPGAVVILPQNSDGSVTFVRQYRFPLKTTILELPAGTLDPNEAPDVCAKRELSEEIGKRAETWRSLGTLFPAPGFCNEVQHCFLAQGLSDLPGQKDADEIIEVETHSLSTVFDFIKTGELRDAKSIALLMRANLLGYL